jgi:hypothetical protein
MMDIRDLTTRQIANALVIFAAAIPFGRDAVKAALMTAAAESSFKRYANDGTYNDEGHEQIWRWYGTKHGGPGLTLDQCRTIYKVHMVQSLTYTHDAVAGSALTTKDSIGHYQQREMYGYGSQADLMDPAESTRIFLRGVPGFPTRVRHWSRTDKPKNLTIAQACQWVQGSEFPTGENYAPMEAVAEQLINHFGGLPVDKPLDLELLMADQAALDAYKEQIAQAVQGKLRGIDENAAEARRINGVLAGVTSLAGNGERSVEQQVFEHELPNGVGQLGNFLAELNRKVDVIAAAVSDLQNKGV